MTDKPPSLRERQAQLTRTEILQAARRLFAERGYSRTSVRDIAQAAGVSSQTVYDSVGSKPQLVSRLNDLIDAEAGIAAIVAGAMQSDDPADLVRVPARVTRSILEHCGDIVHALVTGAAAEPDLETVLREGHRRHVDGAAMVARSLQSRGALADAVDLETAADTLASLADFRFALMLRDSYRWSFERIETFTADTTATLVLRPR